MRAHGRCRLAFSPQLLLTPFLAAQEPATAPAVPTAAALVEQLNAACYRLVEHAPGGFVAVYRLREDDAEVGPLQVSFTLPAGSDKPELKVVLQGGESRQFAVLEGALLRTVALALLRRHEVGADTRVSWNATAKIFELETPKPEPGVRQRVRDVTRDLRLLREEEQRASLTREVTQYRSEQLAEGFVLQRILVQTHYGQLEGGGTRELDARLTWGQESGRPFPRQILIDVLRTRGEAEAAGKFELVLQRVAFPGGTGREAAAPRPKPDAATARWDEAARELLPMVLAANLDGAALARFARRLDCSVDLTITVQGGTPSHATMSYGFEDADDNGLITADEVHAETVQTSDAAIRKFMPSVQKAVLAQATAGPLNLFRGAAVQAVKVDDGWKLRVSDGRQGGEGAKVVTYVTVGADLRILRLRSVDATTGNERVLELKQQQLGEQWAVTGTTQRTTTSDGTVTTESCKLAYDSGGAFPVLTRMQIGTTVAAATGQVDIRQDYLLRDLQVQWRSKPLPAFGAGDDEAAFGKQGKAKPTADDDEKLFKK